MTVNENTSPTILLQIVFWDLIIRLMSTVQRVRSNISYSPPKVSIRKKPFKNLFVVLICLALGLYIGVLLGFLGI